MSIIADTIDGEEMIRQLHKFDNIAVSGFGRLYFKLGVANLSLRDAWELVDLINDADPCVNVFIDTDKELEFEYFISEDLIPFFRDIVDEYTNSYYRGKLIDWIYTPADFSQSK